MRETKEMVKNRLIEHTPKSLPKAVDTYIEDTCLEGHNYIFYDKKSQFAFCSHCQKSLDPKLMAYQDAAHNRMDKCPVCKYDIKYKCCGRLKTRNASYTQSYRPAGTVDCFQLQIMQKVDEYIMIRRFSIIKTCKVTKTNNEYRDRKSTRL